MLRKGPLRRQAEGRKKAWAAVHKEATQMRHDGDHDKKITLPTGTKLSFDRASFLATSLPLSHPELDIDRVSREDEYIDPAEMFMEPLMLLRDTAAEFGVETPVPDTLLDLLHLRSRRPFLDAIMYRHDAHKIVRQIILRSEIPDSVAVPVGKNVFINTSEARQHSLRPSDLDDALLNAGIEGIIHALETRDLWVPQSKRQQHRGIAYSARTGLVEWDEPTVKKGRGSDTEYGATEGMKVINEQVIGRWLELILGDRAHPLVYPIDEIRGIIEEVGMPYFVRALCTQDGLQALHNEVDNRYGPHALRLLAEKHGASKIALAHVFE